MIVDLEVYSDASPLDMEVTSGSGETDLSGLEAPTVINRDYDELDHKPKINGVELSGNKTFEELGELTITNAELLEIINEQYHMVFGGHNA